MMDLKRMMGFLKRSAYLINVVFFLYLSVIEGYAQCSAVPGNTAFSCTFNQGGSRTAQFTDQCAGDDFTGTPFSITTTCYGFAIGTNDTYQIDADVIINGSVVIDLNQNGSLFEILSGVTFTVTGDLTIIGNSNQVRQLTVDGVLNVGGTLDFGERGGGIDNTVLLGGSGSISADAIINAGNTGCTNDPCDVSIEANSCEDAGGTFCDNQVTLPIDLLSFEVKEAEGQAEVIWVTASELNNDFFTLERSQDGFDYEFIAEVKGAGNSTKILTYSFIDSRPYTGLSYYRLTQTDLDGRSETFRPETIFLSGLDNSEIVLSPNPATQDSQLRIITGARSDEQIQLMIYGPTGSLMKQESFKGSEFILSLEDQFLPGLYLVQVTSGDVTRSTKLLVE